MKTPLYRRVTYITFIIAFLILSPLVILYTMGYRYNLSKGRVQKTGILKITTIPKGAQIILNGQTYEKSNTPAKIEYVLPGDYEIQIKKDGYFDWQKKLAVLENGTTFAEKIILWKKSEAEPLLASSSQSFLVAPDKNNFISLDKNGNIWLTDINSGLLGEFSGGKTAIISTLKNQPLANLDSFSPSGRYVLIKTKKNNIEEYFLLDTILKENKKLPGNNYASLKWDDSSDKLYAYNKKNLLELDLKNYKEKILITDFKIDDFFISGKTLYSINNQILTEQSLDGANIKDLKKVSCIICQLKNIKAGKAFIFDSGMNLLTIIDLNSPLKNIEIAADRFDWLNNNSLLLYNNYELYILEISKNQPDLITRLGTPIKYAIWHPDGRHLFFSTDDKIKIIELDNRELRNIIELKAVPADWLVLDRAGNNLYYSLDKEGIFKLNIQ